MNQETTYDSDRSDQMTSANVFLKMALLESEPVTPVSLVRHASGRHQTNGQHQPLNGDRYAAFKGISSLA